MRMEDIAKIANVSKAAVSLALNGKPGIGSETRDRILRIAKDAGYAARIKPAAPAKQAKTLLFLAFTNSGIVLEDYYQQPFFRELIQHTEERARSKGYSMLFSSVDMEFFERDIELIADENSGNGVILLGTNLSREQIATIAARMPNLVVLDTLYETLPIHFVEINNVMGAHQAATHLHDIGHREIGYVASSVRIHNFDSRKRGFKRTLKDLNVDLPDSRVFTVSPTVLSVQESFKEQLSVYKQATGGYPTALFCENDYIAISVMKTLAELGLNVPEDVSVIGFDNIRESIVVSPELTTIHVEKELLARTAVDLLVDSISENSRTSVKTVVDTVFTERLSCAAPAAVIAAEQNV
ncbi:LacI family DNA-binding transcriptional regulator [Paenibacillus sp. 19GGS1-52]|uniref:LacI family DNA-binding transcriptional regulator n=1 Tax=Paenibacillus sp. 19GGS1-52 TaxID=2758563 RepID=UPI001EFB6E8D|nr:LacI family DNA-binding transcriptional regulator [Paenibacillus sp. 19GGS1-52]ULO06187.1 LacI family DNA-binding transcriptional regulator [Paenibacillus sp. 19GGS1-52]